MQPDAQAARARAGRQRPSAARRQRQAGGQKVGRLPTAQGPAGRAEITQLALDGHSSESVARRLGLAGPHRCPVIVRCAPRKVSPPQVPPLPAQAPRQSRRKCEVARAKWAFRNQFRCATRHHPFGCRFDSQKRSKPCFARVCDMFLLIDTSPPRISIAPYEAEKRAESISYTENRQIRQQNHTVEGGRSKEDK
jgi:hypothetical protein